MQVFDSGQEARMAGYVMSFGRWKRRLGAAVPLRQVPQELGLTPRQVGALVRRGSLPVHSFKVPGGAVFRMVRQSDLDMTRASLKPPTLNDLAAAFETLVAQG
jgi:hypothetical protein